MQAWLRLFIQSVIGQVTVLATEAGDPNLVGALLSSGASTREALVAGDLFEFANDRITLAQFIARHGSHGPAAGELSSRSWREDPGPVERLLHSVRRSEPPQQRRARTDADRKRARAALLGALPASKRAPALLALRLAPLSSRTIEHTKTSFLITGDAARRAIGHELAAAGLVAEPEDAFYLFAEELYASGAGDLRALVAERRAQRE